MRHGNARTKLSRTSSHRKALFKNMCIELIRHERIQTTETKAKALTAEIAKVITLAKRQDHAARRRALQLLQDSDVVHKLFETVAPRFSSRNGGYTRIYKLGPRLGDAAPMAIIELLDRQTVEDKPEEPQKKPGLRERFFGSKKTQDSKASAGAKG